MNGGAYQVVHSVDLGIGVNNSGTILAAVVGAHLGGADKVVANGEGVVDGADVGGREEGQAGAGRGDGVDHGLDEHLGGLLVAGRLHVRVRRDNGVALGVDAQRARRGEAVGHVRGDGEDTLAGRGARALVVAGDVVGADVGGEEDGAVLALGEETRVGGLVGLYGGVGAVENGVKVGHAKGSVGLDLDGKDGVIHEGAANGQVKPLVLGRKSRDVAGRNVHELSLGSDSRVVEDARSRQGTSRQDDSSTLGKSNGLACSVGGLDLDTSHLRAGAHKADNLGTELQSKVVEFLSQRQVSADGASTHAVLDVPSRVTVDLELFIGLLAHVDRCPAKVVEKVGEDRVQFLVVTLTVGRGQCRSRVALVQSLGGGRDTVPVPTLGPFLKVVSGRVDKDHVVDSDTTSQNASSVVWHVGANVLGPYIETANVGGQTGEINLGQGVVPAESVVGTGGGSRSGSTLNQQDLLSSLGDSFSSDDTSRASSNDNVVINLLASGRYTEGQAQGSCEAFQ